MSDTMDYGHLMLSLMALNMVYRSAYGGMQAKEFEDLLSGKGADVSPQIKGLIELKDSSSSS